MVRSVIKTALLGITFLVFPATSLAATQTIGQVGAGPGAVSGIGHDVVQIQTASGSPRYSVPSEGLITEWRHVAEDGETGMVKFGIYRPLALHMYLVVAKTGVQAIVPNILNSFPISPPIPVRAGDVIGMRVPAGGIQVDIPGIAGDTWESTPGDAANGATITTTVPMAPRRLDLAATFDPEEKITGAIATPPKFAPIKGGPAETPLAARSAAQGTTFRFALSDVATVTYSIARAFRGTLVNNVCMKAKKKKKKKGKKKTKSNCTGYEPVGAFQAPGGAGENARPFSGVLGKKPLSPGGYRATLTAKDSAGNVSDPATVDFTVLKAKKAKKAKRRR